MCPPSQSVEKFFAALRKFFDPFKRFKKLMIKNERHPSWVSFVTIFLPGAQELRLFRQAETADTHVSAVSFSVSSVRRRAH